MREMNPRVREKLKGSLVDRFDVFIGEEHHRGHCLHFNLLILSHWFGCPRAFSWINTTAPLRSVQV